MAGIIQALLADDHALMRAGLRDALNDVPGVEVVGEVGNGRELVQALSKLNPDLLVVDVNMPEFEPVVVIRKIRTDYPNLKILVVSAYDDQAYVVGLLSAGVNGYHLKDQPLSDFHLAVRRVLDGGRWISDPLVNRLVSTQAKNADLSSPLTRRQQELLYLLTQGYNNHTIARVLNLSIKTVENHLTTLYRAIDVEGRLEANLYANRHPELLSNPEQEKPILKIEPGSSEDLSVLVVDDNPRYRAQLAKLLRRACPSCVMYEADESAYALRQAEEVRPRLAFIDVALKDEDGIQCARQMKKLSPDTRIILISAYPDWGFRQNAMKAGAIAFLDKKDIDALTVRQVVEDSI